MSKRWIYMSKGKEGSSLKKLAAGSLTFVKAYSNGQANSAIDVLEQELETEIERDRQKVPDTTIARLRHKGGKILHGKHMLLLVVVLNVIDCALVLGELVLDLHHVKDILIHSQKTSSVFLQRMQANYPDNIAYTDTNDLQRIYEQILKARIDWDFLENANPSTGFPYIHNNATETKLNTSLGITNNDSLTSHTGPMHVRGKRSVVESSYCDFPFTVASLSPSVSFEEQMADALHKTSLFIVCVLIVETALKVFCFGKQFFEHKVEVFDAFIVVISFVVDLIFLEGLSAYSLEDFVYILAFILPWGVIRVVNSLVVVVRDHEHFRLKLLYTQKKKVDSDNKQLRQEKEKLSDQVDSLRRLCLGEGVEDFRIQQSMNRSASRPGKGIMGSFASLAMGAIGGGKSNGTSFWNLLNTPKLKRGKSEEWEGKLGVSKVDNNSMRFNERLWTVSGLADMKKPKKSQSLTQQGTTESEPGTPPTIRGRLKALKRLLRRQETVDSYSSTETIDKNSRFSLDRLSSSDNITPLHSVDVESVTDMETGDEAPGRLSLSPYDVINECMEDKLDENSILGDTTQNPTPKTNIIVTTCSTDECDSLTFSTEGCKDSLKGGTSGGRTLEVAVDIEYSDSEETPMLHQEPEVLPTIQKDHSPDHNPLLNLNRGTEVTQDINNAHIGHLPSMACGHHSHSNNCIPSKEQHKMCDIAHNSNKRKCVSRNRSMPSNPLGSESGLSSDMAMQNTPVKHLSDPDTISSIENVKTILPQNILGSPNGTCNTKTTPLTNSWHLSNNLHLLDKTVSAASEIHLPNTTSQNKPTDNYRRSLHPTSDSCVDYLSNNCPLDTSLSGGGNSESKHISSSVDIPLNNNITGMSNTTDIDNTPLSTGKSAFTSSTSTDQTPPQNGNRSTSKLLPSDKRPSPDNHRSASPNNNMFYLPDNEISPPCNNNTYRNMTPSPSSKTPSIKNTSPPSNKTSSPKHTPFNKTPSPRNTPSPSNKTPSPRNTPSPSNKTPLPRNTPSLSNKTPSPRNTPSPSNKTPSPGNTPSPSNKTPSPRNTPSPSNKTPSPRNTPSPNNRTAPLSVPTSRNTTPRSRSPSPGNITSSLKNMKISSNNRIPSPTNRTPSPKTITSPHDRVSPVDRISRQTNRPHSLNNNNSPTTPNNTTTARMPSPSHNSTSSRSPSLQRSPSPSGFVSIHTSNNDITSGFQPIQIPETHLDNSTIPLKPCAQDMPTYVGAKNSNSPEQILRSVNENVCPVQANTDDSSGHSQTSGHHQSNSSYDSDISSDNPSDLQRSSDSRTSSPDKVEHDPIIYFSNPKCPGQDMLRNCNISNNHPSGVANGPKQLELPRGIKTHVKDMFHKSLDHNPPLLDSKIAPNRRTSMH